jgi:hypothetical protein
MAEPDRVAMLSDLHALRDELTERLEGRFDGLEARFDGLEARSDGLESRITSITSVTSTLQTMIVEEGETTRRHFNIMVEKVEAAVKIVAAHARHRVASESTGRAQSRTHRTATPHTFSAPA